jgi:hypothetical protein
MAAAAKAGLTKADLDLLVDKGAAAAQADAGQQEQLAASSALRTGRKLENQALFARDDALRDRLPAVIGDLGHQGQTQLATWLGRLSFARYRFRDLAPESTPAAPAPPGAPPADPDDDVRRVTRVEREDAPTRAAALGAFCRALLKQGREPIVSAFEARSVTRAQIESIASDAETVAETGRNVMQAAEATSREAAAVGAQRRKWQQVRRMVRKAVKGVPELEKKYAEC